MSKYKDFLGNDIEIGMRAIRVGAHSHHKFFDVCTVEKFRDGQYGDDIGILSDGNERIGYTYPHRIIVDAAFNQPLIKYEEE